MKMFHGRSDLGFGFLKSLFVEKGFISNFQSAWLKLPGLGCWVQRISESKYRLRGQNFIISGFLIWVQGEEVVMTTLDSATF